MRTIVVKRRGKISGLYPAAGIKKRNREARKAAVAADPRLDYQPLFGKMSPHSSPERFSRRIKDRTRETAEIESRFSQERRPFMIDYLNEGPREQVSMGSPGHAPQECSFPGL